MGENFVDVSKDTAFKRVAREFSIVGGLKVAFLEPLTGDDNSTNLRLLATSLIRIGSEDLSKMNIEDKEKLLSGKSAVLTAALIRKMNEFLGEKVEIAKKKITPEEVVTSIFENNTMPREISVKHEGRSIKIVIQIPDTSAGARMTGSTTQNMAIFCTAVNSFTKESEGPNWIHVIEKIPYHLGKNIADEYNKLFDICEAYILDDATLSKQVENF